MKNEIKDIIKKSIRKSILNITSNYGTKIYLDSDGKVKSVSAPNKSWETSYMKKTLLYIPAMRSIFDYAKVGKIKDNITEKEFKDLVETYADEEEVSIEESFKFWSNSCDYKSLYYYVYDDTFEKSLNNYIEKYTNELNIIIKEDLSVEITNY